MAKDSQEELPRTYKRRGIPVTGIRLIVMPTLMKDMNKNHRAIPAATMSEGSFAADADKASPRITRDGNTATERRLGNQAPLQKRKDEVCVVSREEVLIVPEYFERALSRRSLRNQWRW